ncbi:fatty-acyl-CoA synthase/long-chain acyl-CoA synthetase [Sulfitobacter undariae]|uniref:Fatty-acyl-CoA synthase/long-chain acyl-CoA synthetase n=1 Tax=Sulfitobacter undariae TaxID=1563671 RepID=A0A7W6E523_9RHOB|nr:AMP-binding protein [Sulfitobacter undariae]MBB3994855.1 fatty-acyl-CoA synthase/long-chain acyl-CoA synthetase [Sulfitobacter undariae]
MTQTQELDDHVSELRRLQAASWPAGVPREITYRKGKVPLSQYIRAEAKERPDDAMVHFYGNTLSWAEVDALSDKFAGLLQKSGVSAGDRVGVMMGNCPQFTICFWGIMKLGAILVPVNPMFKAIELTYQLNDSGAETLVFQDDLAGLVAQVLSDSPVKTLFATGAAEMIGNTNAIPLPAGMGSAPNAPNIARLLTEIDSADAFQGPDCIDLDAVAALNYTGGTTGMPKGCVHTHGDMLYTVAAYCGAAMGDIGPDDVIVNFFPMFWIAGEDLGLLAPVYTGASICMLHRWDAIGWMAAVAEYRASAVTLLVDNAVEVMRHEAVAEYDLSSLNGTSVCSFVKKLGSGFRQEWRALTGSTMVEASYGMTETNTCDTFTLGMQGDDYDLQQQPVFAGLPVTGTDIIIRDFETGALKPLGKSGEICVRSPSVLKSYWNKPDETAHAIRAGWLHTGDIGMVNEQGYVHYLGRRKEMLKVNGMPVFPAEIEMLLGRHPSVVGSGVIGRQDAAKGEVPVAFVQLALDQDPPLDAETLRAWCRDQMASFKVPEIRLVDSLPMTATGKVKKDELTALL